MSTETTNSNTRDILDTLENIELLAIAGDIGNPLTAITARLLKLEILDSETQCDALERAADFIVLCKQEHQAA